MQDGADSDVDWIETDEARQVHVRPTRTRARASTTSTATAPLPAEELAPRPTVRTRRAAPPSSKSAAEEVVPPTPLIPPSSEQPTAPPPPTALPPPPPPKPLPKNAQVPQQKAAPPVPPKPPAPPPKPPRKADDGTPKGDIQVFRGDVPVVKTALPKDPKAGSRPALGSIEPNSLASKGDVSAEQPQKKRLFNAKDAVRILEKCD